MTLGGSMERVFATMTIASAIECLDPCTCADDNVNMKCMLKQFRRVRVS